MPEVPSMWRIELLHPATVHFPIALLMVGTLAWVIGRFVKDDGPWDFLVPAGRLALVAGTLLAWFAIYTGTLANAEVARSLCDPRVKKEHEELAWVVAYIFSAAVTLELAVWIVDELRRWKTALYTIIGATLLAGSALLGYVGHEGAKLVYQQAAAVHQPTDRCVEFE